MLTPFFVKGEALVTMPPTMEPTAGLRVKFIMSLSPVPVVYTVPLPQPMPSLLA